MALCTLVPILLFRSSTNGGTFDKSDRTPAFLSTWLRLGSSRSPIKYRWPSSINLTFFSSVNWLSFQEAVNNPFRNIHPTLLSSEGDLFCGNPSTYCPLGNPKEIRSFADAHVFNATEARQSVTSS